MAMTTTLQPAPTTTTTPSPSAPTHAHLIPVRHAGQITEAYVYGLPLTALCGLTFIPSRDPTRLPVCPDCTERK